MTRRKSAAMLASPIAADQLLLSPQRIIISQPLGDVVVFASGMNRIADIRGAAIAGVPIGVDVSKLSPPAIDALVAAHLPLLLDSGAFSEIAIHRGHAQVTAEIFDREWMRRLAIYLQVTREVRRSLSDSDRSPSVTVVAPDRVGSQELTLERLSKFRTQVREIYAAGAEILIPLQVGRLDLYEFYTRAKSIVGTDIVPAFPMKKAATTIRAILDFVERTEICRIHLLGMGASHRNAASTLRLIRHACPDAVISMDSNRIRAAVGARRAITCSEAHYREGLTEGWTGALDLREWGGGLLDMTELIFEPSRWLQGTILEEVANSLSWLTAEERNAFLENPDEFVSADENANDWLFQVLLNAYSDFTRLQARGPARTSRCRNPLPVEDRPADSLTLFLMSP